VSAREPAVEGVTMPKKPADRHREPGGGAAERLKEFEQARGLPTTAVAPTPSVKSDPAAKGRGSTPRKDRKASTSTSARKPSTSPNTRTGEH